MNKKDIALIKILLFVIITEVANDLFVALFAGVITIILAVDYVLKYPFLKNWGVRKDK